jgi:hypothetical protein
MGTLYLDTEAAVAVSIKPVIPEPFPTNPDDVTLSDEAAQAIGNFASEDITGKAAKLPSYAKKLGDIVTARMDKLFEERSGDLIKVLAAIGIDVPVSPGTGGAEAVSGRGEVFYLLFNNLYIAHLCNKCDNRYLSVPFDLSDLALPERVVMHLSGNYTCPDCKGK